MTSATALQPEVQLADDICSLSLARRMAALLNRNPAHLQDGSPLPRGWHVLLFNPPTIQDELRGDGAANLGFAMPDLGLPRLMMGGRKIVFDGEIPIGSPVVRESTLGPVVMKEGRSGRFALLEVEHRLSLAGGDSPVVTETNSYVLRAEEKTGSGTAAPLSSRKMLPPDLPDNALVRVFEPDEPMLFRYSAITDNPHRIHYDHPYATAVEGYPALVVNGSLPQMVLLEMFRQYAGREPCGYKGRNITPIFCGSRVTLSVSENEDGYALAAYLDDGRAAIEAEAW